MSYSGSGSAADGARRVLHVTTVPASLSLARGQIRHSKAHGWTVHVLSAPGAALTDFGQQEGVAVHSAELTRSISPWHDLRAVWQIAQAIREVRPDIVHGHTPKGGLLAMLAASLFPSIVRIYQIRGLPLETATGGWRVLLRTCERVSCGLAHRVYCDSASLQNLLLSERLVAPAKCVALLGGRGSGVDALVRWHPARVSADAVKTLRQRLGIPADGRVVGFIGRLANDKGLAELQRAWQRLRLRHANAHLLLLGAADERDPVPDAVMNALREDATVHIAGRVPDPVPYYALMDVVALPTYREGLPNVLLEAAAMGLPVVATRVTGCVDAVVDGVTGLLVEPRSDRALASALDAYLGDAGLRARHGRAGRERMLREFRQEPLCAAYQAEYDALLRKATRSRVMSPVAAFARRGFDVALALMLLIVTAPLLLLVALAVRLDLGSPVLFRQVRAGAHGQPFTLHKFRTMREARGADGRLLPPEARLTRLGRWLRATSLDELPELWDVLRGRMSLIGPRPLLMDYLPLYSAQQARRHEVRPGLTGWAQVNGRNAISWEQKLELDVWYVDHASPIVDLRILLETIPRVFARRGISPRNRAIMERFNGNR